ncbi:MAG: MotA/TolQ/ExbB proton channel family protein [Pseudomonadota bacterium]
MLSSIPENAQTLLEAGGWVVIILGLMSVMALTIAVFKTLQFQMLRLGSVSFVSDAIDTYQRGDIDQAIDRVKSSRNPAAQTVSLALTGRRDGVPDEVSREAILTSGRGALNELRHWLHPLEVIAALAPLLGLFGTVLGMIEAFQQLQLAGNRVDPSILSGGIWKALITTALGLAVAMPTLVASQWLSRRVDRLGQQMENLVGRVFAPSRTPDASNT